MTRTLKSVTTWEYDFSGNEIHCTEAKGTSDEKTTRHEYNTFGQKIRTFKPDGTVLHFEYDLFGCQKTLKSSDGKLHYSYTYDIKNRPICVENVITKAKTIRSYDNIVV